MTRLEAALERGDIDEEQWYREVAAVITPAYLAARTPMAQSGFGGDEAHWCHARSLVCDAIDRNGTFLDVGCANGYLMESVDRWMRSRGTRVEVFGLDISPELAELARARLPAWADRIYVGNALGWQPPTRFELVRTGLEYVPQRRQRDLVQHLHDNVVASGGRLIIGPYKEERSEIAIEPAVEEVVSSWGFEIGGRSERPHDRDDRFFYRLVWVDGPQGPLDAS